MSAGKRLEQGPLLSSHSWLHSLTAHKVCTSENNYYNHYYRQTRNSHKGVGFDLDIFFGGGGGGWYGVGVAMRESIDLSGYLPV